MAKLHAPLRELLDARLSEAQVQQIWRDIQSTVPIRGRWLVQLAAATSLLSVSAAALWMLRLTAPGPAPVLVQLQNAQPLSAAVGDILPPATTTSHDAPLPALAFDAPLLAPSDRSPNVSGALPAAPAQDSEAAYVPHDGTQLTATQASMLMHEAGRARQRADHARAITLLERVRRGTAGSTHAGLAGWTLASMRMSTDPVRAALDMQRALQEKLPESLQETVRARLVEAHARAGATAAARAAAEAYRAAYPQGRYLAEIERWTHAL